MYEPEVTGVPRSKLVDALIKEGFNNTIFGGYANIHLLPMFQKKIAFGKKGIPWKSEFYKGEVNYTKGICPVAEEYHEKKFICFLSCMIEGTDKDLSKIEKIFNKVLTNINELR